MNTQDGYDWPNGCTDERWPVNEPQPQQPAMKAGDTFTMDLPDTRRMVRLWCWLTRRPLPVKRRAFRVTGITI